MLGLRSLHDINKSCCRDATNCPCRKHGTQIRESIRSLHTWNRKCNFFAKRCVLATNEVQV